MGDRGERWGGGVHRTHRVGSEADGRVVTRDTMDTMVRPEPAVCVRHGSVGRRRERNHFITREHTDWHPPTPRPR
jgi:hypothetical protein